MKRHQGWPFRKHNAGGLQGVFVCPSERCGGSLGSLSKTANRVLLAVLACTGSMWLIAAHAQTTATLTTLLSFTNGVGRPSGLVQGSDGNLYGVTAAGGSQRCGSAFRVTPGGVFTTLASFGLSNALPVGGLAQGRDGDFYGTTSGAGSGGGQGTVFRMTPGGALTTMFSFTGDDGDPHGRLVQGSNDSFYGTTRGWYNSGTVFRVTANGVLTTLVSFNGTNGSSPFVGLIQASNGNFYGTTYYGGGNNGRGTVFKMTPEGDLTTLVSFTNTARVYGGLVQGSDGNFYGTTAGMSNSPSSILPGIVFKITPEGALTTLAAPFNYQEWPGTLIQASDGNFYGTTSSGGSQGFGTVFQITAEGRFTTLLEFNCTNGAHPSDLMQATNGLLYGTTWGCGQYGFGTVFQISLASPPALRQPGMSGNQFSFNWNAVSGRVYRVEYSTNLGLTNWHNFNSHLVATNATMGISQFVFDSLRFYRVVLLP
jgi:uncharacterized repeat protein (TIGR03803 family)